MLLGMTGISALLAFLVALRWPTDSQIALSGERAQQVFRLVSLGLLIILLLLLPVFPATSLVREKKQGTLALLLNTPLGPWRIYFGKLISALGLAFLLLTLSLPAMGACYAMGGLSLPDLASVYLLLAMVSLLYSAIGLFVSCHAPTIDAAIKWTYAIILFLSVLSQAPHYFFQGTDGMMADIGEILRSLSPFAALMPILGAGDIGGQGLIATSITNDFIAHAVVLTVIASAVTIARINHRLFDQNRAAGSISNDQSSAVRTARRIFFLIDPQRRSLGIPRFMNPIMVKEFRCRRFGRLHWLLRLVAFFAVASLALTYAATAGTLDWGVETIGTILVVMQMSLIVLITPSLSACLISSERETRNWQLLQTTPLSIWKIATGKLASVAIPLIVLLGATIPGYAVMIYIEPGLELQIKRVAACLVATEIFAMLLSAAIGSQFKRTSTATATAYGALLSVCIIPLLFWLAQDAPFGRDTVERILIIDPIAATLSVIKAPGFGAYQLLPENWLVLTTASGMSLIVIALQLIRLSRPT